MYISVYFRFSIRIWIYFLREERKCILKEERWKKAVLGRVDRKVSVQGHEHCSREQKCLLETLGRSRHLEKSFSGFQAPMYRLDTLLAVDSDSLAVERADDSVSPTCPRWAGVCRRGFQLWGTALLLSSTSFRSPVWSLPGTWLPLLNALLYLILVHLPCLLTTAQSLPSSCLLGPYMIDLCVFPYPGRNIWSSWSGFVPYSWSFLLLYSTLPVLFNETRHHFLIISNNFELLLMESLTSNSALKKKKLPFFLPFGWKPVYYVEFRGCQSSWNFFLVWDSLIEINKHHYFFKN